MKKPRTWPVVFWGVLLACASGLAVADRGHDRSGSHTDSHTDIGVGFVFSPYWYDPWYYPAPYYPPYYYPPAVVPVPATPPVYIERGDDADAAPGASSYWYYCADPQGYYPDVRECPGGWRAVSPQPDDEE
jgi:hypothetical protein